MSRGRRKAQRRYGMAALVAACAGATLVAGGGTYALWSGTQTFVVGRVTAGDLRLTPGTATWRQVTPGVTSPASGTLTSTPTDFYAAPGDVIEITQPVTTFLRGDNLTGQLAVDLGDTADTAAVTATYHVENAAGAKVAPASGESQVGTSTVVPGLVGTDAGSTQQWKVVVTVHLTGDDVWLGASDADAGAWAAGGVVVRLEQVRHGAGFEVNP